MLTALAVSGYRSLRDLVVPLAPVTVVSGPNGAGKSSLYRALRLLAAAGRGEAAATLAAEGGMGAALWAGPERFSRAMLAGEAPVQGGPRKGPVRLMAGFASDTLGYAVDLGLPKPGDAFALDPQVKAEAAWTGPVLARRGLIAHRRGPRAEARGEDGRMAETARHLQPWEGMLSHALDASRAPELLALRERMAGWRFYDHLRADPEAPARRPCVPTRTFALAPDGADLAAAVATIFDIGDGAAFDEAVADAFDGAAARPEESGAGLTMAMRQPGMLRPLAAPELSEGTLRFLLLAAALLTPRPPELIVLNEPETSLHPALVGPLARLILRATEAAQVVVVTHDDTLATALGAAPGSVHLALEKRLGETLLAGEDDCDLDPPPWAWPAR